MFWIRRWSRSLCLFLNQSPYLRLFLNLRLNPSQNLSLRLSPHRSRNPRRGLRRCQSQCLRLFPIPRPFRTLPLCRRRCLRRTIRAVRRRAPRRVWRMIP